MNTEGSILKLHNTLLDLEDKYKFYKDI